MQKREKRRKLFTDEWIKGETEIAQWSDTKADGLVLRITSAGDSVLTKTFGLRYSWDGKQHRLRLGEYGHKAGQLTLAKAREEVGHWREQLRQRRAPHAVHAEEKAKAAAAAAAALRRRTFNQVADEYIEEYAKKQKKSWKNDVGYLKRPRKRWGDRDITTITREDAIDLLKWMKKQIPVAVDRVQSVLHKLFKWAQDSNGYVTANPFADVDHHGTGGEERERVLTEEELRIFWRGLDRIDLPCERAVALALKMILVTARRPAEVASMLKTDIIQFKGGPVYQLPGDRTGVKATKKKQKAAAYKAAMSELAMEIYREAIRDTAEDQPAVFASRFGDRGPIARHTLSQALAGRHDGKTPRAGIIEFLGLDKIAERNGADWFTPHDLRRTAATLVASAVEDDGETPRVHKIHIPILLNHHGDKIMLPAVTQKHYDHSESINEKRVAVRVLEEEIRRIVGLEPRRKPLRVVR